MKAPLSKRMIKLLKDPKARKQLYDFMLGRKRTGTITNNDGEKTMAFKKFEIPKHSTPPSSAAMGIEEYMKENPDIEIKTYAAAVVNNAKKYKHLKDMTPDKLRAYADQKENPKPKITIEIPKDQCNFCPCFKFYIDSWDENKVYYCKAFDERLEIDKTDFRNKRVHKTKYKEDIEHKALPCKKCLKERK